MCYEHAIKDWEYQTDWLKEGYAPKGYYLKDFTIVEHDGVYHLFHIQGTPGVSCCLPGNEIFFGHAATRDFLTWRGHPPVMAIREGTWEGGHVFAPFVLKHGGRFWMFYTGATPYNCQRIGVAVSDDLMAWRRFDGNPVIRPELYPWAYAPTDEGSACRDPHVIAHEDGFLMYYTAVNREGRGVVAVASSRDLLAWRDEGVAYEFAGTQHCESSNVQLMEGRYYLFFGGHHEYWSYVASDNPRRWPSVAPTPLIRGVTAMEVVERKDPVWLVAYFKAESFRLYLATIDWSAPAPVVREIRGEAELAAFRDLRP